MIEAQLRNLCPQSFIHSFLTWAESALCETEQERGLLRSSEF